MSTIRRTTLLDTRPQPVSPTLAEQQAARERLRALDLRGAGPRLAHCSHATLAHLQGVVNALPSYAPQPFTTKTPGRGRRRPRPQAGGR